jgi:hypothetical protein
MSFSQSEELRSTKPKVQISGKIQDMKKKEKNIKPKQSNFLLTLNTNQQYKEGDVHLQNDIEVFNESIDDMLQNIDAYIRLPEGHTWNDDLIKDVKIDYTIERGGKKNQLHIHILFKLQHFTKVQLDYQKIKDKLMKDLGLHNIYCYNRLLRPNDSENIMDYMSKYV